MSDFKVGEKYNTPRGLVEEIERICPRHPYPLKGAFGNKWTIDGVHFENPEHNLMTTEETIGAYNKLQDAYHNLEERTSDLYKKSTRILTALGFSKEDITKALSFN